MEKERWCWGEGEHTGRNILPRWSARTTSGQGVIEPAGIVVVRAVKVTPRALLLLLLLLRTLSLKQLWRKSVLGGVVSLAT